VRTDGRILCFGELLLRLAAPGSELLLQSPRLEVSVGGAEANVAVALAKLGHDARMLSFVPDNALGRAAIEELRRHAVDVSAIGVGSGRMGLYFLSPGAGPRAAEVTYDRAGSTFANTALENIDWKRQLDGVGLLHLSGITPALNARAATSVILAAKTARQLGVTLSLDCNYRAKLWETWGGGGPVVLKEILTYADLVFGDYRDMGLILGTFFDGDERNAAAAQAAFAAFPNLRRLAFTERVQHSANHHELTAVMHTRSAAFRTPSCNLTHIVDRIGAGDAFAAGLIHGLRRGKSDEEALRLALASTCLKHVTPGDFGLARERDLEAVIEGNFDVKR
jgi:2-dehydro-3-deoxygluconokinase